MILYMWIQKEVSKIESKKIQFLMNKKVKEGQNDNKHVIYG